jgi:flavorubredoxin
MHSTHAYIQVSINFLKNLMRREFTGKPLKGGDVIDLGGGHALEFVMAPNLHWPDSMFSFDPATRIMYTCDAFGSHYCSEDPWDTDVEV